MKTTSDYLREIKELTGLPSDGATGLAMGWTRPATTAYKYSRREYATHTCLSVAKVLNLPLIQVIADMEIQRERDPKRRADWLPFATPAICGHHEHDMQCSFPHVTDKVHPSPKQP